MAHLLKPRFPGLRIIGSITLNASAGGLNLWAVETALMQDAKVVWLPTWSARNDQHRQGVCHMLGEEIAHLHTFTEEQGLYLLDSRGVPLPAVMDVIALCRDAGVCLCTGHISVQESLAIARAAKDAGFGRLVFTHPDSRSIGAKFDEILEMAKLGAYIEICALGLTPPYRRITPKEMCAIIRAVGPERCFLSTDYFFEWASPVPEQMRQLMCMLMLEGMQDADIRLMARETPRFLLDVSGRS
jgi:hypothetical protein